MRTRTVTSLLLVWFFMPTGESCSLHQVEPDTISTVAAGSIDVFEHSQDTETPHEVWLYTAADCNHISWTLGGQLHSEPLSCGQTTGFINVPPGTYYTVIEGCGKRIAAYLCIHESIHLVISPADLHTPDTCPGDDQCNQHNSCYVDSPECLDNHPIISEL